MDRFKFCSKLEHKGECLVWTGWKDKNGYGVIVEKGKQTLAHRFSYLMFKGALDPSLTIDHLCRNRACVNPEHLEQVSRRENTLRGHGFAGVNSRKTSCVNGHEYSETNTYIRPKGHRDCKVCVRARGRDYYQRVNA